MNQVPKIEGKSEDKRNGQWKIARCSSRRNTRVSWSSSVKIRSIAWGILRESVAARFFLLSRG